MLKFNQFINEAVIKNGHLKSPHHSTLTSLGLAHTGTGKTDSSPMYKYDGATIDHEKAHKALIGLGYKHETTTDTDPKHTSHHYSLDSKGLGMWLVHHHAKKKTSATEIDFSKRIKSNGALVKRDNS